MKLYLVHCGYYDPLVGDGLFESHYNFFVTAESFEAARAKAKDHAIFREKKMHVDGLQCIEAVDGHRLALHEDLLLGGRTEVTSFKYRGLAPVRPPPPTAH